MKDAARHSEAGPKTAVLFLTHTVSEEVLGHFKRLQAEVGSRGDVFFVLHTGTNEFDLQKLESIEVESVFARSNSSLLSLPYPRKCDPAGWSGKGWHIIDNVDTLPLSFFTTFPGYSHYWGIEYDVQYTGNWGELLDHFGESEADLIGAVMEPFATNLQLNLAPPLCDSTGQSFAIDAIVRGFFPLFRASNRFMSAMDGCYRSGWNGHYELSWGTCAKLMGLSLEAFSGSGPLVQPQNRNRFYFNTPSRWDMAPGTFVFSPVLPLTLPFADTLWHPIKPGGNYYRHSARSFDGKALIRLKRAVKLVFIYALAALWGFWRISRGKRK